MSRRAPAVGALLACAVVAGACAALRPGVRSPLLAVPARHLPVFSDDVDPASFREAIERTIPAHAVPCPHRSPSPSSEMTAFPSSTTSTTTARWTSPTSGCPPSTPLSRTHTETPAPLAPAQAHSAVTGSGQSVPIACAVPAGRLHAGSDSYSASATA